MKIDIMKPVFEPVILTMENGEDYRLMRDILHAATYAVDSEVSSTAKSMLVQLEALDRKYHF